MVDNSQRVTQKLLINSEAFFINLINTDYLDDCLKVENSLNRNSSARSLQDLKDLLSNYKCFGLFDNNKQMLGFCVFSCVLDESELIDIAILKKSHNKGLAYHFLTQCFNILKSNNIEFTILEVSSLNIPAIKTYQKFNYQQIGIRKNYYTNQDGSKSNALVYKITF